jgi:hypothetical protein
MDTMLCSNKTIELPPTPKSTTTFKQFIDSSVTVNEDPYYPSSILQLQQQNRTSKNWMIYDDAQTSTIEESTFLLRRGSKADAADVFIMTKPIESNFSSSVIMHEQQHQQPISSRSAWWLCSSSKDQQQLDASKQLEQQQQKELSWFVKTCNYLFSGSNSSNKRKASSSANEKVLQQLNTWRIIHDILIMK